MDTGNLSKWINACSVIINIAVPVLLYYFYGLNLLVFCLCFILMDLFLILFEQLFFITVPFFLSKIKNIKFINYRINRMKQKKAKVEDKIEFLRRKNCKNCDNTWHYESCTKCEEIRLLLKRSNSLTDKIRQEEKNLCTLNKKQKSESEKKEPKESQKEKRPSEASTVIGEKKDYFAEVSTILSRSINEEHLDCLIPLRKSANSMSQVLKGKPNGKSIIPVSMYVKIDNTIVLVDKIVALPKETRVLYLDELKEISKRISDDIQLIIVKINKCEKEEQQNEINVLINELSNKEDAINA